MTAYATTIKIDYQISGKTYAISTGTVRVGYLTTDSEVFIRATQVDNRDPQSYTWDVTGAKLPMDANPEDFFVTIDSENALLFKLLWVTLVAEDDGVTSPVRADPWPDDLWLSSKPESETVKAHKAYRFNANGDTPVAADDLIY